MHLKLTATLWVFHFGIISPQQLLPGKTLNLLKLGGRVSCILQLHVPHAQPALAWEDAHLLAGIGMVYRALTRLEQHLVSGIAYLSNAP